MLKDAAGNYTSPDWSTFDGYAESKCPESECANTPGSDECVEAGFSINGAVGAPIIVYWNGLRLTTCRQAPRMLGCLADVM